jgi:hypothetical protein
MCNLYSMTTNQAAIARLFRLLNQYGGNLPSMPGVFPDYPAPLRRPVKISKTDSIRFDARRESGPSLGGGHWGRFCCRGNLESGSAVIMPNTCHLFPIRRHTCLSQGTMRHR